MTLARWLAVAVGALGLVAIGIARFADDPDLARVLGAIAIGVALIGVVVLALWLPAALSLMQARRSATGQLLLVAGDRSVAAAASMWRSTALSRIPNPSTYAVLEFAHDLIGIWAGGLAAERIATIPASTVESVTLEYGPFHTRSPISYLSVQLGAGDEIRFAVSSFGPLGVPSRKRAAAVAESLAGRFAVPLLASASVRVD